MSYINLMLIGLQVEKHVEDIENLENQLSAARERLNILRYLEEKRDIIDDLNVMMGSE